MRVTSLQPSVDLEHLSRQTGGNEGLGREVLRMFLSSIPADLTRLKMAAGKERREAAHLILGSARAIGAVAVAEAAAAIEAGQANLAELEAAVADARQFIAAYLSD
jgi:HPt (histidine-containing phosphotransfer) domain-containing protein